jgi:hypothetical protein
MNRILIACAVLLLAGCAGPDVALYAHQQPALDVAVFLGGATEAWGMFQKRSGEVVKRFHVDIDGRADGASLVLDERFKYSDGTTQRRIWRLTRQSDGSWRGTAADVVGEAIGQLAGNALHWQYTLRLPVDDSVYDVQFDDWMFLIDDQTLINRARMSKFGIELGQVTLLFRKPH